MKGLQLFLLALLPCAAGWLLPQGNVIFSDAYLGAVEMVEGLLLLSVWYWAGGFWRHRMKGTGAACCWPICRGSYVPSPLCCRCC